MMEYSSLESPDSIPKVFAEAWNARDAKKLASLFEEDAEFINVTGLWWHNRNDIEKAHAYGLGTIFKDSDLKVLRTVIKVLSPTTAVVIAKIRLTGQTPLAQTPKPGQRTTIFTFVVHRKGSKWSCVSAQNTDVIPNMETHIRDQNGKLTAANYRKG